MADKMYMTMMREEVAQLTNPILNSRDQKMFEYLGCCGANLQINHHLKIFSSNLFQPHRCGCCTNLKDVALELTQLLSSVVVRVVFFMLIRDGEVDQPLLALESFKISLQYFISLDNHDNSLVMTKILGLINVCQEKFFEQNRKKTEIKSRFYESGCLFLNVRRRAISDLLGRLLHQIIALNSVCKFMALAFAKSMVLTKEVQISLSKRMEECRKQLENIIKNNFYGEKEALKYYIIDDEDSKANDFLNQLKPYTTTLWDDLWAVDNNIFRRILDFILFYFFKFLGRF